MPSLRKRVSSYFRQLSFYNEPREKKHNINENSFITKYLEGHITLKEGPPILYGKNPTDLPNYDLGLYEIGPSSIVGCYSGPNGGLTTVRRLEKHLSIPDSDIDFIDTQDEPEVPVSLSPAALQKSPNSLKRQVVDNTTMVIKVAGQEYLVTNRKKQENKSQSLGSLSDFEIEIEKTKICAESHPNNNITVNNNNNEEIKCKNQKAVSSQQSDNQKAINENQKILTENQTKNVDTNNRKNSLQKGMQGVKRKEESRRKSKSPDRQTSELPPKANYGLSKSKSEGNPFQHKKKGKIIRISNRPTTHDDRTSAAASDVPQIVNDPSLPEDWNRKSDHVYGISDSLYDRNQVTKNKNGDPIADCFGIIARNDSAILAVADGVNWGEKASIAAKSAVHGCLHYLDKTIFNDTRPFDDLTIKSDSSTQKNSSTPIFSQNRVGNTRDIFVCLLRAFNCAHDLILENQGMLTTLTVAVILPLKSKNVKNTKPKEKSDSLSRPKQTVQTPKQSGRNTRTSISEENIVDSYVCCVCNVGDTLAYVYSQKYGVRELTKGSHDINCNRDMRDALGALGPVDGINPELSNLTLSVTVVQRGDVILVASDGLTDNFDPNVCKFTVNSKDSKLKQPTAPVTTNNKESHHNKENINTEVIQTTSENKVKTEFKDISAAAIDTTEKDSKVPVKPPRKNKDSVSRSSRERSVDSLQTNQSESSTSSSQFIQKDTVVNTENVNITSHDEYDSSKPHSAAKCNNAQTEASDELSKPSSSHDVDKEVFKSRSNWETSSKTTSKCSSDNLEPVRKKSATSSEYDNPLVAQFMRENSLDEKSNLEKSKKSIEPRSTYKPTSSQMKVPSKTLSNQPKVHVHKTASKNIPLTKTLDQKSDLKRPSSSTITSPRPNVTGFLRSKTSLDMRTSSKTILRNEDGIPFVTPMQRYEISLLLIEDILKHGISGHDTQCTTARKLCENLVNFTFSISSAKRHTLEDTDLYFDNVNGVLVEVSQQEKKVRRRKGLERVQNLPGKLDHVSIVAYNVGNFSNRYQN